MTLAPIEAIFIIFFILSIVIGVYCTYKCHKDLEKYKVKIYPDKLQKSADNLPA